jgi:predicted metal-dependent phosphoesterase TrpH
MNYKKITPYYGYTLEDLKKEEALKDYEVVWPHVHTQYSIGTLPLRRFKPRFNECEIDICQLLKTADKFGVYQIVITDHDELRHKKYKTHYSPIKGALKAVREAKKYNVNVIPGQEITFTPEDRNMNVHILLFPLKENLDIKYKTGTIEELADYCKDNHIKMVAPHPLADGEMKVGVKTLLYDPDIPKKVYDDNINYFDAISVINTHSFKKLNMATIHATCDLNKKIARIGESDAHSYRALGLAGTLIPKGCSGLVDAIEDGTTTPFGTYGASIKLMYSWATNAYDLNMKYFNYMIKDPYGKHEDGFEVFKQIHGEKFDNQKWLMYLIKYVVIFFRYTIFPVAKYVFFLRSLLSAHRLYKEIISNSPMN